MIRSLGVVLVVLAALGGCTGADPAPQGSQQAVTVHPDVAELLGTPVSEVDVVAEFEAVHTRAEELTKQCMEDLGLEYRPVPFVVESVQPAEISDLSLGVADQYFAIYDADFDPGPEDPNRVIVAALSVDERLVYDRALHGEGPTFDPRIETGASLGEAAAGQVEPRTGCRVSSQQTSLAERDRNHVLVDEYTALRNGLFRTDQRMIRARAEWAVCMREAGFRYNSEPAMYTELADQAVEVLLGFADLRDGGMRIEPLEELPPEAAELVDRFRRQEATAAAAHADCREGIDQAISVVREDIDAIFLEEHS